MILFNLIRLLTHRRYSMALTSLYPSFCYQFQNFRKIKNNFWNKFVLQHLILINQNTGCILIERKVFYACFMKITFGFWHWWFLLKPNPSHDDVTAWKRFGNTLYIYIYIYIHIYEKNPPVTSGLSAQRTIHSEPQNRDSCFDRLIKLLNKQSSCRWFETSWHLCDVIKMLPRHSLIENWFLFPGNKSLWKNNLLLGKFRNISGNKKQFWKQGNINDVLTMTFSE